MFFAAHAETGEFFGYIHGYQRFCTYEGIRSDRESHIDQVAVAPDRHGFGIGSLLVNEWTDVVSSDLAVTVWAVEGMLPFFERWKFERVDPPDDEILQPVTDADYMRLEWVAIDEDVEAPDDTSS